uniref:Peptidoglycan-associated lipoprotein n=1 Tax=Candidatus Kentrum sp. MB TaxID=2138164 RepID=A0A450XDQ1_9GAMM|nr:MAG: peptidoglycan-associated lipoprotein [Candidatus Kentron sp. MB]VFK30301.1 MAG: peptidoglycan-associated lipoprotein [Candidatus Kentron sp. MB]VFK74283.1 MAG: peptidoglycan-associated lipoprotein [Candidatus Kentron sp. MB]
MNTHTVRLMAIGLSSLALVACTTTPPKDAPPVDEPMEEVTFEKEPVYISPLDDPNSLLSKRVIYFDFDRSDIKPEYREILEAHVRYLADNINVKVTLAGHCDERGTREYNLALGERRAKAISRSMSVLGALDRQLYTVSYGEEQPAQPGNNEFAWEKNRRVEIIYPNR